MASTGANGSTRAGEAAPRSCRRCRRRRRRADRASRRRSPRCGSSSVLIRTTAASMSAIGDVGAGEIGTEVRESAAAVVPSVSSTTGAAKHTAVHPSTSTTARASCGRLPPPLTRRGTGATSPVMRMWVRSVAPRSKRMSRCLPTASTVVDALARLRPASAAGGVVQGRGGRATCPASAGRSRLAVRWSVSPSGTAADAIGRPPGTRDPR